MIDLVSLSPIIFLIFSLPQVRDKFFSQVDVEKFAYGAVTCGILLTFYGIWIGLAAFDTTDIGASIPLLLDGLKTAFGSSLVGLGTSLLINLFFVSSEQQDEKSLKEIAKKLNDLNNRLETFTTNSAEANIDALMAALKTMTSELEMGINTETAESMEKFRDSTEVLYNWQRKYMEEIKNVTEAMDKNAVVTQATSDQLDRTNAVLSELAPVTEQIAESIEWVQMQLPAARRRKLRNVGDDDGKK
tara:strand:+ start:219 stop:953 length:735 start_codon:yes stop_codon:yes gene_type:complete